MAFPVVAARNSGRTTTTNTTSHAITLPAGISAGDLLVVVFACDGNPTISVDTGVSGSNWNALTQGANTTVVSSNVFWKIAEGGDALTLTTSVAEQSSHVSLRITGGYSVTGTSANGSSTNSNPPSHAGHDGTQDYLWIATRAGDSTVLATVAPTNFTNLQSLAAAGTGGASINTAERSVNSSSQDPGTFTSASEQWVSFTIAVSPLNLKTGAGSSAGTATASAVGEDATPPSGGTTPLTYGSYLWSNYVGAASYTFTGMSVGTADADRWVIAAVELNHAFSTAVTDVTIGGVTATLMYQAPTLSGPGMTLSWWKANVPTGTTADVFVQCNSTWYDGAVSTYHSIGEPLVFDTAHDNTYTGTTFSVTVDVAEGGAVLALVRNDGAGTLTSWSGVAADQTDETYRVYVASQDELSAETGRTVSWTGTTQSTITDYYGLAVLSVELPLTGGTIESGAGSSAGSSTAAATGESTRASSGTIPGVATATATGASTRASAGSSAGTATASGVGASVQASSGTVAAAGTASGVGASVQATSGSSAGVATASAQGATTHAAAGVGAGIASVTGEGNPTHAAVGTSAGAATAQGAGDVVGSVSAAAGSAAGVASVTGAGSSTHATAGSTAGVATASGQGAATHSTVGTAAGVATAQGAGDFAGSVSAAAGSSSGVASATGAAAATHAAAGSTAGAASVTGEGNSTHEAAGAADGSSTTSGAGSTTAVIISAVGVSQGEATALAVAVALNYAVRVAGPEGAYAGAGDDRIGRLLTDEKDSGQILTAAHRAGTVATAGTRLGEVLGIEIDGEATILPRQGQLRSS